MLLLHGIPETHLMWHRVAPHLAEHYTVVATDLRGYGDSGKPASTPDHEPYSMRAIGRDQIEVMQSLGFDEFRVAAHDRGARCAYRLALDEPDMVIRLAVMDVVPVGGAYDRADRKFSLAYWVWSFLASPYPVPEQFIAASPATLPSFMLDTWPVVKDAFPDEVRRRGDRAAVRQLRRQRRGLPKRDPQDPDYRRLRYTRYADDQLFGFTGPKAEAEQIKTRLATFLREDLKLEMSQEKTLITHARTGAARFLGYEITVQHADHRPTINGSARLRVPMDVIKAKCSQYMKLGKPEAQSQLVNESDHTIVATYGAKYRGLVNYYLLAADVWRLNRVRWVMHTSLLKTLACKYHSTATPRWRPASGSPSPHRTGHALPCK